MTSFDSFARTNVLCCQTPHYCPGNGPLVSVLQHGRACLELLASTILGGSVPVLFSSVNGPHFIGGLPRYEHAPPKAEGRLETTTLMVG